ncbi:MAG: hypothetical protein IID51_05125 [Proteobacteria bacterium]|nr:hypothetical protein [Pseudomonadota bacterium]
MNRPIATKPLDLAAAVEPRASARSPLSAIMLLFFAATIVFEFQFDWGGLIRDAAEAPASGQSADFTALEPARIDRRSDYSEYLRAPIFLATREPISLPNMGRTAAVGRSRDLGLELFGTILSEGEPVALMKTIPNGDVVLLRRGEELGGWTLLEIEDRLVRLQRGGELFELYLDPDRGPEQTGPGGAGDTSLLLGAGRKLIPMQSTTDRKRSHE